MGTSIKKPQAAPAGKSRGAMRWQNGSKSAYQGSRVG